MSLLLYYKAVIDLCNSCTHFLNTVYIYRIYFEMLLLHRGCGPLDASNATEHLYHQYD